MGILGVTAGVVAALASVNFDTATFVQWAALAGLGGLIGTSIGFRITPTSLPQTVAALHSVAGLAAVLTSIGIVLAHIEHIETSHLVTAYLGIIILGRVFVMYCFDFWTCIANYREEG